MPVPAIKPYFRENGITLYYGDAESVIPSLGEGSVQCVLTDPPYSERTHCGHNAITSREDNALGRDIHYDSWNQETLDMIIPALVRVCTGWIGIMTDHHLMMSIHKSLEAHGRYVFAPLVYYAPGSRVRLAGDGPSSWSLYIVVARTALQRSWGTLPGGYVREKGWIDHEYIGGKPVELMKALVRDYSKPNDVVLDPYAGSGTTGVACIHTRRQCIMVERDKTQCDLIVERVKKSLLFPNTETRFKKDLNTKLNAKMAQLNKRKP